MGILDRALGITLAAFSLGALTGAIVVLSSNLVQSAMLALIQYRLVEPVRNATELGGTVVAVLIFVNNSVPVVLSFLYPVIVGRVAWTPPLSKTRKVRLMTGFSVLAGFLIGFFNLGAVLSLAWLMGGVSLVDSLLSVAWLHAPLEFFFVLLGVSEPLRLVGNGTADLDLVEGVRKDLRLLLVCLFGLLTSSLLEVFLRV